MTTFILNSSQVEANGKMSYELFWFLLPLASHLRVWGKGKQTSNVNKSIGRGDGTSFAFLFSEARRKWWRLSWPAVMKLWITMVPHRLHHWEPMPPMYLKPDCIFESRNYSLASCHLLPWTLRVTIPWDPLLAQDSNKPRSHCCKVASRLEICLCPNRC